MEKKKGYSMFERDKLDPADSMRIERNIYFEEQTADLSGLTALPLEQLQALREEYAAAEQAAFEALQEQAAAWDEQAGKTLAIDKAIEYVRTPEATHTANQWEATDYGKHISNRVYQMRYHISENTRYDREKEKSIPYSWTLSWSIYTNSPHNYGQAKIAGQERKVFADKAAMEKYLNGRIKAYQHLFTEVSPPIPPEYAEHFKVNGQLLPGYAIEGEERAQPTAEKAAPTTAEPPQDTEQRKERETINEQFSILIDSRSRFETGKPGGVWLPMPTTTEQLHAAMESVGITADNPQDFFINGYSSTEDCPFDLPLSVIQSASMDELNYFGKLLEMQSDGDKDKFAAAVTHGEYAGSMKDLINLAQNLDCYWLYPTVRSEEDYGYYLIDELDELELPEEAKKYFKYEEYGRDAVSKDKGQFTEQGYIYNNQNTFTEWYRGTENEIPKEYRVMSFPQPERGGQRSILRRGLRFFGRFAAQKERNKVKNGDDEQRHAAENKARALLPDGLEVIHQTAHGQREDHAADQRNDLLARRKPPALARVHKAVQPFVFQREGRVQNQVRAENQNDEQPHLHALRNGQKRRQIQGCEHQLIDQIENQNHLAHGAPAPHKTGGE